MSQRKRTLAERRLKATNITRILENKTPLVPYKSKHWVPGDLINVDELNKMFDHIYECLWIVWPKDIDRRPRG